MSAIWATARATPSFGSPAVSCVRWLTAVICVVAVHAGVVWRLISWPVDASEGSAGAFAVDLAPEFSPGTPEATEPTARSGAGKQPAAPTPLTAPPSPASEPVAAAAPRPTPEPEKELEKEKVRPDETATAEPPARPESSSSAAAAAPTAGVRAAKTQAAWYEDLLKRIERYKGYPKAAMAQRLQGLVTLKFTVDRAGRVLLARVVQSSGSQLLDAEAMAMLMKAAPLPLPPPETPGVSFELELPIRFALE